MALHSAHRLWPAFTGNLLAVRLTESIPALHPGFDTSPPCPTSCSPTTTTICAASSSSRSKTPSLTPTHTRPERRACAACCAGGGGLRLGVRGGTDFCL